MKTYYPTILWGKPECSAVNHCNGGVTKNTVRVPFSLKVAVASDSSTSSLIKLPVSPQASWDWVPNNILNPLFGRCTDVSAKSCIHASC